MHKEELHSRFCVHAEPLDFGDWHTPLTQSFELHWEPSVQAEPFCCGL
jgi:hypothetical protein